MWETNSFIALFNRTAGAAIATVFPFEAHNPQAISYNSDNSTMLLYFIGTANSGGNLDSCFTSDLMRAFNCHSTVEIVFWILLCVALLALLVNIVWVLKRIPFNFQSDYAPLSQTKLHCRMFGSAAVLAILAVVFAIVLGWHQASYRHRTQEVAHAQARLPQHTFDTVIEYTSDPASPRAMRSEAPINVAREVSPGHWQVARNILPNKPEYEGTWLHDRTNPSALQLANGSIVLAFRGSGPEFSSAHLGIAIAIDGNWTGPYTIVTLDEPILADGWLEDPFLYTDSRGNFHILYHNILEEVNVGGHLYSHDLLHWNSSGTAYTTFEEEEEEEGITLHRRERPVLYMLNDTCALFITGVVTRDQRTCQNSMTLIQYAGDC